MVVVLGDGVVRRSHVPYQQLQWINPLSDRGYLRLTSREAVQEQKNISVEVAQVARRNVRSAATPPLDRKATGIS
jgi:hypothetical protein